MTLFNTMKERWTRRETAPATPPAPVDLAYTDHRRAPLDAIRRALTEARSALTRADAQWATLHARQDDPETDAQRQTVGPRILDLRQQIARLERDAAALDAAITATATTVRQYAQVTTTAADWVQTVLDRLPTDDELQHAYRVSRQIESAAADLLRDTGDRVFRRPRTDPRTHLREALEDRVQTLAACHLLRSTRDMREKESA